MSPSPDSAPPAPVAPLPEHPTPIVGIGASAGGLDAYKQILTALPGDTGLALVLVPHRSPDHQSLLSEILSRVTSMPVMEVNDEPPIEPNRVYIIPPGRNMLVVDGHLKLVPQTASRGKNRPIDEFLQSLADNQRHRAIGVILSGTGHDGTAGLLAIKAEGGVTFAQDDTAQHPSMPRSAVAAGCVDFVLPPDQIAAELRRIARHPLVAPEVPPPEAETTMSKILRVLHDATRVDFSHYKTSTLFRRVSRRMLLHNLESLADYLDFLRSHPAEIKAMYQDILISVTTFFRDPECFETLKSRVFPNLLHNRLAHDPVRMWILGCSTGEEAYSLAIALAEYAAEKQVQVPVQIFATDLNEGGIECARTGFYPRSISQDVSPERLRNYFTETEGGYRISRAIRDMCVFARQNVLVDPPFSRMDLISCRNLLIYMEPALQRRIVPLFHYALKGGGYLWLGTSETVTGAAHLFEAVDQKHKIFARQPSGPHAELLTPIARSAGRVAMTHSRPPRPAFEAHPDYDPQKDADRLTLARYAPRGVLINSEFDVIQFRGDTGQFLAPPTGKPSNNLLKMAREGLLISLRTVLQKAAQEDKPARADGLQVKSNGGFRTVDVEVIPLHGGGSSPRERCYLVLFHQPDGDGAGHHPAEALPQEPQPPVPESLEAANGQIVQLTQELAATREFMQSLVEQQEAANEELQSANEEIQSSNEELQSTNEELQTTKEEIQSSNEELTTVNEELRNRNEQLNQAHSDLLNFLTNTQLPLVMLDSELRIRRFTPAAEKTLNLIAADTGRSITDLNLPIRIPDLPQLVRHTMDSLQLVEREVQDKSGRWHSLRLRPYRTLDNRIDGTVLVLVDIDDLKRIQDAQRDSEARFRALFERAAVGIKQVGLDGRLLLVNQRLCDMLGYTQDELLKLPAEQITHPEDRAEEAIQVRRLLAGEIDTFALTKRYLRKDGGTVWSLLNSSVVRRASGQPAYRISVVQDVTAQHQAEDALRLADAHKDEFLAMLAHELRNPLSALTNSLQVLNEPHVDPRERDRCREVVDRQIGHLTRMVNDLLDVSRIRQGKIELDLSPVDLSSIVRQAAAGVQAAALAMKRQYLTVSTPPEPVVVEGDAIRLEQVIVNLLNNACKYSPDEGRISLTLEREGKQAVVKVKDEGIGISSNLLPRVFDLFVQGDASAARERGGLGIGLSVVKQLVQQHGGSVAAYSEGLGRGSEFIVRLPLSREQTAAAAPPKAAGRPANVKPHRLLVIDDNRDAAESLATLLTFAGHDVQLATSGPKGVELAGQFRPEAVLLDIGMPGMDGYAVAKALREKPETRKVLLIAMTGYGRDEDRQHTHDAGFDVHLVKPVKLEDVEALLARLK